MMNANWLVVVLAGVAVAAGTAHAAGGQRRLFILSGQSNMVGLAPQQSFTPAVTKAFPGEEIIVVKSAKGGQPIRRWYRKWQPPPGAAVEAKPEQIGDLYDELLRQVRAATGGRRIDSVCFVWMQGERDARERLAAVYAASLRGLIAQLRADLRRDDMRVVIGRLSDAGDYGDWQAVRKAQVEVAEGDALAGWVNTDDLNGPASAIHYTKEGYAELGRRFAAKAVELLGADAAHRAAPASRPALPRALLIGDSISLGYGPLVGKLLAGRAAVEHAPGHSGDTRRGLANLKQWLGTGRWDVIHFNWGLHDLKEGGTAVPIEEYARNLRELVRQLRGTGAALVWASTTPVPPANALHRRDEDVLRYNRAAQELMQEAGVAVDDLYTAVKPRLAEAQQPNNVHFSPAGYRLLAEAVARSIEAALAARGKPSSRPAWRSDK